MLEAFERAFAALYQQALLTLGEVTLGAIVARVLADASERFPLIAPLTVDRDGARFTSVRQRPARFDGDQLAEAFKFVLVEMLTVLGRLTAEILTPELHAVLARLGREAPQAKPKDRPDDGEEKP